MIVFDKGNYVLYDLIMTNTNELVSLTPAFISEALLNIHENKDRFDLIKLQSEEEIISTLINRLPESDDNREGWLDSLSIATIGYRKTSPSNLSTIEEQNNEISKNIQSQLENDFIKWGDTWKKRPIEGQLERTESRFRDYVDQHENGDQTFPWLKVMGGEIICLTRIDLKTIENYKKA